MPRKTPAKTPATTTAQIQTVMRSVILHFFETDPTCSCPLPPSYFRTLYRLIAPHAGFSNTPIVSIPAISKALSPLRFGFRIWDEATGTIVNEYSLNGRLSISQSKTRVFLGIKPSTSNNALHTKSNGEIKLLASPENLGLNAPLLKAMDPYGKITDPRESIDFKSDLRAIKRSRTINNLRRSWMRRDVLDHTPFPYLDYLLIDQTAPPVEDDAPDVVS